MTDFEAWYRGERPLVLSACLALARDPDTARDATDEAFARAFERWERVSAMQAPGAWTQTVALNDLRRRFRRRPPARALRDDQGQVPAPDLPDQVLWAAVRGLPARQQTAVVLRYVHDLSYEQMAGVMGISAGAVGSTLAAAHRSLARRVPSPTQEEQPTREEQEEKVDG